MRASCPAPASLRREGIPACGGTEIKKDSMAVNTVNLKDSYKAVLGLGAVFPEMVGHLNYCTSGYEAAGQTQAVLVITEWEELGQLDLIQLRNLVGVPVLVDGRSIYDPAAREAGFEYISIGRDQARHASLRSFMRPVVA